MKFIFFLSLMFISTLVLARGKVHPIAHLAISNSKCETPCSIDFDASKSKSSSGLRIMKYIYNFGDGDRLESSTPTVTHTYHSTSVKLTKNNHFKATLLVEDEAGNISKEVFRQVKVYEGEFETINKPPLSSFTYFPKEPKASDTVTLTSLSVDDQEVVAYEWHISDGRVLTGKVVDLVFQNPGLYTITHIVRDDFGLSAEVSNIVPIIPNTVNNTLLTDFIGIRADSFNPKLLSVKVIPTNGTFHIDPEHIVIYLNGLSVKVTNFSFNPQELSFSFEAKDGKNSLSILGVDSKEETFSSDIDFYAGSKTVNVDVSGSSSSGCVTYYPLEDKSFRFEANFQNGSLQISNVPEVDIVFDVLNDASEFAYETLSSQEEFLTISLQPNRAPSSIDNDDFTKGAEGWTVSGGVPTIVNKMVKGTAIAGDYNLRIYTDSVDEVVISRTFKSKEANRFVRVDFNYLGGEDENLHVVLRNETTGEYIHRIFEGKDNTSDLTALFDISKNISVRVENVGDIIHLDIKRVLSKHEVSFIDTLSNSLITSAYAQTGPEINRYVDMDKISFPRRNIWKGKNDPGFEAHSWFYKHSKGWDAKNECHYQTDKLHIDDIPLAYLSVGPSLADTNYFSHNILTTFFITQYDSLKDPLRERPDRANLYIVQRDGTRISRFSTDWKISSAFERGSESEGFYEQFTFSSSDISHFNAETKLKLVLEIEIDGEVFYEELPRSLTPLKWYNHDKLALTSCKDSALGGALWVQKETASILDKIFGFDGDIRGFAVNDISKLNGGHFPTHKGHRRGTQVDYKTTGIISTGKTVFANAPEDIHAVLNSANQLNNVESIFLSLTGYIEAKVGDIHALPNKIVRARCTANNYLYSNFFVDKAGHVNHGHINFNPNFRKPVNHSLFGDFRPSFYTIDGKSFYFKVDSTNSDMNFIWEIRKDDQLVEVLDNQTLEYKVDTSPVPLSGMLTKKNSNLSEVSYTFPSAGGVYSVHLVAVLGEGDSARCMGLSMSLPVSSNVISVPGPMSLMAVEEPEFSDDPFCFEEWQTFRGRDTVDPVSGHRHIAGAIVSEATEFKAGRFYSPSDSVLICGKSKILDSYTDFSGCPEGQSKEECASIVTKGFVDTYGSTFDARNGRIELIGNNERVSGVPVIEAGLPVRFDPLEDVFMDFSTIMPSNGGRIIIQSSEIIEATVKGGAIVQGSIVNEMSSVEDNAIIQLSFLEGAKVAGSSHLAGASAMTYVTNFEQPQLNIIGNSYVSGVISTDSRLDIEGSTITKDGSVWGTGLIRNSYVSGMLAADSIDPNLFSSERIATVDSASIISGGILTNNAHILNLAVLGNEESFLGSPSYLSQNSTLKDGAILMNNSYGKTGAVIEGEKTFLYNAFIDSATVNSKVGGSSDQLLVEGGFAMLGAKILGTPIVIDSTLSGNVTVSDDAEVLMSGANAEGFFESETIVIKDKARVINFSGLSGKKVIVGGNTLVDNGNLSGSVSMADNAIVSSGSVVIGNIESGLASLSGTVHVSEGCHLEGGSYSSGYITPFSANNPCMNSQVDPVDPVESLMFTSRTLASSTEPQVSTINEKDQSLVDMAIKVTKANKKIRKLAYSKRLIGSLKRRNHKVRTLSSAYNQIADAREAKVQLLLQPRRDRKPASVDQKSLQSNKASLLKNIKADDRYLKSKKVKILKLKRK